MDAWSLFLFGAIVASLAGLFGYSLGRSHEQRIERARREQSDRDRKLDDIWTNSRRKG